MMNIPTSAPLYLLLVDIRCLYENALYQSTFDIDFDIIGAI